jgi:DNA-binding NtrC family response regulator
MYSVLVVDDEAELRKQIVSLLSDKKYHVEEASSGKEALAKLHDRDFALILCDVRMPEMDGLQFLRYVREHEIATTVALVTAHGNVRDALNANKDGAFEYI